MLAGYKACDAVEQSRGYPIQNFIQVPRVLPEADSRSNNYKSYAYADRNNLVLSPNINVMNHGYARMHQKESATALRAASGESELEKLKLSTLKEQCRALGLAVSGTKSELIDRIIRFQALSGGEVSSASRDNVSPPAIQFQAPKVRVIPVTDAPLSSEGGLPPTESATTTPNPSDRPKSDRKQSAAAGEPIGRGAQSPRGFGKIPPKKSPPSRPRAAVDGNAAVVDRQAATAQPASGGVGKLRSGGAVAEPVRKQVGPVAQTLISCTDGIRCLHETQRGGIAWV
jgi:hypothetical protein